MNPFKSIYRAASSFCAGCMATAGSDMPEVGVKVEMGVDLGAPEGDSTVVTIPLEEWTKVAKGTLKLTRQLDAAAEALRQIECYLGANVEHKVFTLEKNGILTVHKIAQDAWRATQN